MSETKHTPGPWQFNGDGNDVTGGLDYIATTAYTTVTNRDEDAANLHLIAAAPDLLNACRIALQCCQYGAGERKKSWDQQFVRETIEAAITKAKGEQ